MEWLIGSIVGFAILLLVTDPIMYALTRRKVVVFYNDLIEHGNQISKLKTEKKLVDTGLYLVVTVGDINKLAFERIFSLNSRELIMFEKVFAEFDQRVEAKVNRHFFSDDKLIQEMHAKRSYRKFCKLKGGGEIDAIKVIKRIKKKITANFPITLT